MALQYQTGTPSSVEDLIDKLQTFAAANNFTVDDYDAVNNECTIHESNMYVHFGWFSATDLNICQSLGYSVAAAIDAMPDDSGNGSSSSGTGRRVNFESAGPWTAYHFFCEDGASGDPMYIHVVVEVSSGVFRHFGFGTIEKVNDWVGGEYAYGHLWGQSVSQIDNPASTSGHTLMLDAITTQNADCATMHIEGVDTMTGSQKWGVFTSATLGVDDAGEARVRLLGGGRNGLYLYQMRHIHNSNLNAYVPIIPIPVVYVDTTPSPDTWCWLGQMSNVGVVNMHNMSAGDEFTLGGETWKVFPWVRKQFLQDDTEESWNAGYAYRKS